MAQNAAVSVTAATADPLSDILSVLGLRGRFRCRTELVPDAHVPFEPRSGCVRVHVCLAGRSAVLLDGGRVVRVEAHDIALVPNDAHTLGGGERGTVVVSGECLFDFAAEHPLLDRLGAVTVAADDMATLGWMRGALDLLGLETHNRSPGALVVTNRALEILFVQGLRALAIRHGDDSSGSFMAALVEPALRGVLERMHTRPAERWTLERLADEVGLSRSVLSERFHAVAGVPPIQYLIDWRMQLARHRLRHTQRSVTDIASDAGYESATAFRRRFKARQGITPSAFRARARIADPTAPPSELLDDGHVTAAVE